MSMQKPPCEPTAEMSVCVNCIDKEDKSNEGTESPGYKGCVLSILSKGI